MGRHYRTHLIVIYIQVSITKLMIHILMTRVHRRIRLEIGQKSHPEFCFGKVSVLFLGILGVGMSYLGSE